MPSAQILRELQELGVGFGTYGPSIKPQELKNQMLLRIPKLQWLTVQQSGMCARVVVRERPDKEAVLDRKAPTDVIAARAGVLTRVEAGDRKLPSPVPGASCCNRRVAGIHVHRLWV